ncbi:MAG: transketolase family protein [Promethearchaeota archaeon]
MTDLALRDVFGNLLVDFAKKNKDLVVLDADLSTSTRTSQFAKVFPNRFFNMGIAEQNMVGAALGFAISGKIPVVSGFTIFTVGRAWEFIRLACHDKLNVKIITTHGGIVGEDGSTHNALEDLSLMASLPNLTILIPADNKELKSMLDCVFNTEGPFYIRLPREKFSEIHDNDYKFSINNIDVLKKGSDICVIGCGYGSVLAYNTANIIEEKLNISLKIINLSNIKPINTGLLLNHVKSCKGILIIEEHNIYCGIGSIIARIVSENNPLPIKFVGIEDTFVTSGKRENLLDAYGLNPKGIMMKLNDLIENI